MDGWKLEEGGGKSWQAVECLGDSDRAEGHGENGGVSGQCWAMTGANGSANLVSVLGFEDGGFYYWKCGGESLEEGKRELKSCEQLWLW